VRLLLALFLLAAPAFAVQPDERLTDPALEARARAPSRELRCIVCQNESIDASEAELARDLRVIVRQQVASGASDAQVRDFLTDRYGEYVLLKPSFSLANAALWLAPFAVALLGGLMLLGRLREREPEPELSDVEAARLAALARDLGERQD